MAASSSTTPLQPLAPPSNNPFSIGAILNPVSTSTTPDADNINDSQESQDAAASTSDNPSVPTLEEAGDADEADIAKQWHRACPTLRTIILPKGKVWFQNPQDGPSSSGTSGIGPAALSADGDNDPGMDTVDMGPVEEPEWSVL
jgi:hypothetical protein